jgi:hypothetical protein
MSIAYGSEVNGNVVGRRWLLLRREVIRFCSENRTENMNTICETSGH